METTKKPLERDKSAVVVEVFSYFTPIKVFIQLGIEQYVVLRVDKDN